MFWGVQITELTLCTLFPPKCESLCSAEMKLAIVLAYVTLLFIINIIKILLGVNRTTNDSVYDYFLCETSGTNTCSFPVNAYIVFKHIFAALFCLAPLCTLIYIVPSREIRMMCRSWRTRPNTVPSVKSAVRGLSNNTIV